MKKKVIGLSIKKIFVLVFAILSMFTLFGCGNAKTSVNVDGIEISKKNLYMAEGQTTAISAQVFPFNASNQNYSFESDNESVVTIEDGFVVAKKAGDAVIYVYSEDGGYRDSCNVLVTKAKDNLALNEYNNLNMPEKELEPIYNSDDYTNKNVTTNRTNQTSKRLKTTNKQNDTSKPNKNGILKQWVKASAKKVNNEIQDNIDAGKNVLEQMKTELQNSINNLEQEKEMIKSTFSTFPKNDITEAFNNIQCEMLNMFKATKQSILNDIQNTEQKIDDGDYTVESKNINGVTFVVVKDKVNSGGQNIEIVD